MRGALYPTRKILTKYTPNPYLGKLQNEFLNNFCDEEKSKEFKGQWREIVYQASADTALDLEIGTGNGFFFAHHCFQNPNRKLIGLEIKYRPIYQTLRRMQSLGNENGKIIRMHASQIDHIFSANEIDNTYIYFPDPWPKTKHHKNRLIEPGFLKMLFDTQKSNRFVEFKTDNPAYFEWSLERFKKSSYQIDRLTYDLHQSEWAKENFQTHFERLWTSKGLKTMLLRAYKV
jgi:tRNA (guanine-N7-)-methyltransferase